MLPGFVTQPAGSPGETSGAVAAAAVNGGPVQAGDATSTAAPDGAAAFDSALASACDAAAPATPASVATRSAKANGAAAPQEKPSAASESAFAIWRLMMGLDTADVAETTSQPGGKPAGSGDDDEATATADQPAIAIADTSCLPQPVMADAVPSSTLTTIETGLDPSADADSAAEASGSSSISNTIGNLAGTSQTASDDRSLLGRVLRPAGEPVNPAASGTAPLNEQMPAGAGDWSDADAASAAAVTSASPKGVSTPPSAEAARTDERSGGLGLVAAASVTAADPANEPVGRGVSAPATAPVDEPAGRSLVAPATATVTSDRASTPSQGRPSLAPGTVTTTVAATDPAPTAGNSATAQASPGDSATLPMQSGLAAPESRAATSGSAHAEAKAALEAAAAAAVVNGTSATAAGNHESSSRDNPEARGRASAQELAFVTRTATAFSPALTLVALPDGTLRLASGVSAPVALAPLLPEQATANIDQMVQSMRVMVKDSISEATVHLRPEHFGDVRIQVRVDGKNVSAIVHTDSTGVHEWLNGQESTIRSGLAEHGLQLDRLIVQRDGRQDRRHAAHEQPEPRRRRVRRDADSNQTFEVSV